MGDFEIKNDVYPSEAKGIRFICFRYFFNTKTNTVYGSLFTVP